MSKGKASDVGESSPTQGTEQTMSDLVDGIVGEASASEVGTAAPPLGLGSKSKPLDITANEDGEIEVRDPNEVVDEEEEQEEGAEAQEERTEEEEEVIAKSKHQEAIEAMQKRIDQLTAKVKQGEAKKEAEPKTQEEKLQRLSIEELQELSDNVDDSIMDLKVEAKVEGSDVSAKIKEMRDLKKSINSSLKNFPQRFQQRQVEVLNSILPDLKDLDPDVVNNKGPLWDIAVSIYNRSSSFQRAENGMAEAMILAAEHFQTLKGNASDKEVSANLSRQVNTLKKKTALDGKNRVANTKQMNVRKLKEKAVSGTYNDKVAFVETLVPENFISR